MSKRAKEPDDGYDERKSELDVKAAELGWDGATTRAEREGQYVHKTPIELRAAGRLDWWWANAEKHLLCEDALVEEKNGCCPIHGGDACLLWFAAVRDIEQAAGSYLDDLPVTTGRGLGASLTEVPPIGSPPPTNLEKEQESETWRSGLWRNTSGI